jgi:hypothetical protein
VFNAEQRHWAVSVALVCAAGCGACSQKLITSDAAAEASAEASADAAVRPQDSGGGAADVATRDAVVIRDAGPEEVQWFEEGDLCTPLPEPWINRFATTQCTLPGCIDVGSSGLEVAEEARWRNGSVILEASSVLNTFDERDRANRILAPTASEVRRSLTACGSSDDAVASREWLDADRSALLCELELSWTLRIVDTAQRRQCTIATGRRAEAITRGSGGLRRMQNAWAWHENFQRAKDDVVILDDGAARRRRITDTFGVRAMFPYNGRLYWAESNWTAGTASLRMSAPPYRTITTLWTTSPSLTIHRMSQDVSNPAHIVFEVARGDETAASRGEVYFADLSTIDTVPPRNLTNDAGSQFHPLILGDRVVFTDISNSTISPDGAPSVPHDRWDLVLMSLQTGARRVLHTNTTGFSSLLFTQLGVYLYDNNVLAVLPIPER